MWEFGDGDEAKIYHCDPESKYGEWMDVRKDKKDTAAGVGLPVRGEAHSSVA